MNGFNSRIIFQSNAVAEFWYELQMNALQPPPAVLPIMQCELGKYVFYELLLFCSSSSSSIKFYSTRYFLLTHLLSIRNGQKLYFEDVPVKYAYLIHQITKTTIPFVFLHKFRISMFNLVTLDHIYKLEEWIQSFRYVLLHYVLHIL